MYNLPTVCGLHAAWKRHMVDWRSGRSAVYVPFPNVGLSYMLHVCLSVCLSVCDVSILYFWLNACKPIELVFIGRVTTHHRGRLPCVIDGFQFRLWKRRCPPKEENCRPLLSTVSAAVDALHFATPRSAVLAVVERLLLAAFSLNELILQIRSEW